jgi:hypothetical protein
MYFKDPVTVTVTSPTGEMRESRPAGWYFVPYLQLDRSKYNSENSTYHHECSMHTHRPPANGTTSATEAEAEAPIDCEADPASSTETARRCAAILDSVGWILKPMHTHKILRRNFPGKPIISRHEIRSFKQRERKKRLQLLPMIAEGGGRKLLDMEKLPDSADWTPDVMICKSTPPLGCLSYTTCLYVHCLFCSTPDRQFPRRPRPLL